MKGYTIQNSIDLLEKSGGGGGDSSTTSEIYPTGDTPVMVGMYGDKRVMRQYVHASGLVTGSNTITIKPIGQFISIKGGVQSTDSAHRIVPMCSNIAAATAWNASVIFTVGRSDADLWIGQSLNGGSADIWIDYIEPVTSTRRKIR